MIANYPQHIDKTLEDNAITHWKNGELVAIPTETVYGLAADAENSDAVAKIFALKDRPRFNPLIVHVGRVALAQRYVIWNDMAERLAAAFWPGPLTLVLPLRTDSGISDLVTCGGNTLGLRMPAHPLTLALLKRYAKGIAAPSANRSGRVSPTTAQHVRDEFGANCPLLLDGGNCEVGLESTVLDISSDAPVLLRPGAITKEMLEAAMIASITSSAVKTNDKNMLSSYPQALHEDKPVGILKSPGQLASHYAPSIPVRLNATSVAADEALLAFGPAPLMGAARSINLSETGNLAEAATRLFAALRALDMPAHRAIAVMPIPNEGIGEAIHDRLKRAATAP